MNTRYLVGLAVAASIAGAQAEEEDGPRGIKFFSDRLTMNPYVAMSYTYDSNIDSGKHSKAGSQWVVNPGVNVLYKADNWDLDGQVFYRYHAYNRYVNSLNQHNYGETLNFNWKSPAEAGWTVKFSERFEQIAQDDDMSEHGGRGIGRDRKQFNLLFDADRRINEHLHGGVDASYYMLDYDNNNNKYASMYGWDRLRLGGTLGYTASKWSDVLVSADYQFYNQDNDRNREAGSRGDGEYARDRRVKSDSKGWSVMGGLGTHATEKISYRVLMGWSHFEYGGGVHDSDGWTYRVSANWQVDERNTLNVMLLGSSYYQPSEREYGSAIKVYSLGLGARKTLLRSKLDATVDLCYRKETHEYTSYASDDYDEDIYTIRLGLTYKIKRWLSVYGRIEYQTEETEGGGPRGHQYDYDRWRGTVGVRMTY